MRFPTTLAQPRAQALSTSTHGLHAAARAYAQRGWLVFPCVPGSKVPAIKTGFHAATTNPATIDRWWGANPNYNIAIRCGACSRLWVLDLDGGDADAIRQHGLLPATLIAVTANGRHLYFIIDRDLPSTIGKIGPGIDTRGHGGYVLAPPSLHPSGKVYTWITDLELAPPPPWLIDLACRPSIAQRATAGISTMIAANAIINATNAINTINADAYGKAALASEIETLAATAKGARNHQLNTAAFNLFQLVAGGVLTEAEVTAGLVWACQQNGLWAEDGHKQCRATIASGARAGLRHPRGRP